MATKKKDEKPVEAVPEPNNESAPTPEIDAVVVVRQVTDDGGANWVIGEIHGNIQADQVPTGLRLAARDVEKRLDIA